MTPHINFLRRLDGIAIVATVLLPLGLTHFRGIGEVAMDVLAIAFILRSGLTRDWSWLRRSWVIASLAWWVWQVVCSMPVPPFGVGGWQGFFQAMAALRFLLLAAALGVWTLRERRMLQTMVGIVIVCTGYIALQIVIQAVFGYNLFGVGRFHDGTLTGPYHQPRAAAPLSRLILPALMVGCVFVRGRLERWKSAVAMTAMSVAGVIVMVLAGQRMPFVLLLLGLAICAVLYRPIRPAVVVSAILIPPLIAAAAVVSPGSFAHLVLLARDQLGSFGTSPYGRIFARAVVMAQTNPLTGLGYDAFRHACTDPTYFHNVPWLGTPDDDGGGAGICVQHAHNHYLGALTNAGLPGLLLFCAMVVSWLVALWPVERDPRSVMDGFRIGAFAAVAVQEWPIASASDFLNLPLGGWAFMLLGIGLATAARSRGPCIRP